MKILPQGKREWRGLLLRLSILSLLLISAVFFTTSMPGRSYSGLFQPLSADETTIRDNLQQHVWTLAGKIGERNLLRYEALKTAADYIENALKSEGLPVVEQEFSVEGKTVKNIETEIGGTTLPDQFVILGAHYDSANGSSGANDNATGMAAMLEFA